MDRRDLKSNGRVAHVSLQGQVQADRFVEGHPMRVAAPVATLYNSVDPGQFRRERELLLHEVFHVLEDLTDWAFGYSARDGFVGYMARNMLADADLLSPTHVIASRQSYLIAKPELKNAEAMTPISLGTALAVRTTHENGRWAEVTELLPTLSEHKTPRTAYVPAQHLRPITHLENDPAAVAERFIGTPYHWGGNSAFGIDCSGLVQAAFLACGIPCPGDSDQQQDQLGETLPKDTKPQRNDLLFWNGHVALAVSDSRLIHANAHHMAVAYEDIETAIARIEKQGDGQVTAHKRPLLP